MHATKTALKVIHEYVSAFGVNAQMTGTTEGPTNVDLPGGVQALYSSGSLQRFRFPDWQGTIRAESNANTRVFNRYCMVLTFDGETIVRGRTYLDSALVARLFEENPIAGAA